MIRRECVLYYGGFDSCKLCPPGFFLVAFIEIHCLMCQLVLTVESPLSKCSHPDDGNPSTIDRLHVYKFQSKNTKKAAKAECEVKDARNYGHLSIRKEDMMMRLC